jgi:type 1 glutamine amidotransferase
MLVVRGFFTWCVLCAAAIAGNAAAAEPAKQPTEPAPAPAPKRLLVVTVTKGFRHGGSIEAGEAKLEELGRGAGRFHLEYLRAGAADESEEDLKARFATAFAPETLAAFDGAIFLNTTGELPIPDIAGFLEWIKSGKAFIGFHAATDTLKRSPAYGDMIGGYIQNHPWYGGKGPYGFVVHDSDHRLTGMYAERFRFDDEIYDYTRFKPENVRVLISLDMPASKPHKPYNVPVSWIRDYGEGRVFYTNFGHSRPTWQDASFLAHTAAGIGWALRRFDAPSSPNPDVQAVDSIRNASPAAAAASDRSADELQAKADAKIAKDRSWAPGLLPIIGEIREGGRTKSPLALAKLVSEIDKP